jgi:ribosomal-protein-alanine N-acetyltransferase
MVGRDVEIVVRLEKQAPSPWGRSLIKDELNRNHSFTLVAVVADEVVGWCCSRYVKDEAELLKISVAESWRRRSVAKFMLAALEKQLRTVAVLTLYLEVRSENLPALSFYRQVGFTVTGRRINYYSQPKDDAVILRKPISQS